MLTVDVLREFGANVDEGLARCVGNEGLYLRLAGTVFTDPSFDRLQAAIEKNDLKEAFEAAHALKGVTGNLSLTPLYTPIAGMTELLRGQSEADYQTMLDSILETRQRLADMAGV